MGGRVFSPELGRFLSADPYVAYPDSGLGWNRYAYTHNNPLRYTDPSGFNVLDEIGDFFVDTFHAVFDVIDVVYEPLSDLADYLNLVDFIDYGYVGGEVATFDAPSYQSSYTPDYQQQYDNVASWSFGHLSVSGQWYEQSSSAEVTAGGLLTVGDKAMIVNELLSVAGVRTIELTDSRFDHIRERHAFEIGTDGAGRFSRGVLNRTTSRGDFFSFMTSALSVYAVAMAPDPRVFRSYAVGSDFGSRIGITGEQYVGVSIPTNHMITILRPTGQPGAYKIWTAFPVP